MRPEIQEEWASFILDLYQCNFTSPHLLTSQKAKNSIVFEKKDKLLKKKVCDGKKCRHYTINDAEDLCKRKKRVFKTIKPANIEILLKEAERRTVDLRVLLYFRLEIVFFSFLIGLFLETLGQCFLAGKKLAS